MATDWTRRVSTVHRVEHVIAASEPWGTTWTDLEKVVHAAAEDYREAHGKANQSIPGDALRIFPGDAEIIVRFEVSTAVTT